MKVGDLVRLSAYGKARVRGEWIHRDDFGIIVGVKQYPGYGTEYRVKWAKSSWNSVRSRWAFERDSTRRDLAYLK